ncbi:hypothetical protein ACSBR2_030625 [Camellia fascicularis]
MRNAVFFEGLPSEDFGGCKELEYLDVSDCLGFNEGDSEILKLASRIRTFKHKDSHVPDGCDDDDKDDYYMYNVRYDYVDDN